MCKWALYDHQTAFTGVSNKNRTELPDEIRQLQRMQGGEVFAYRCSELLALGWQAEKRKTPVIMLSTQGSAEIVTVQPSNTHLPPSNKPAVINLYNHNMNGVDVADQLGVYYSFQKITLKWWRVFFGLLEVTVVNSCIKFKQIVINPKSHLAYRMHSH